MSLDKSLLAAQGYIELGMLDDALDELDRLEPAERNSEAALQMRLFVLMRVRSWGAALDVCSRLREVNSSNSTGYIHGAFCLHEMGRTNEARDLLLSGPDSLSREPTYHYNLGCYAAVLGDTAEARRHLERSFSLDDKFRDLARLDPDLHSMRDYL